MSEKMERSRRESPKDAYRECSADGLHWRDFESCLQTLFNLEKRSLESASLFQADF